MECCKYKGHDCDGCHCCEEVKEVHHDPIIYDDDPDVFHQYNKGSSTIEPALDEDELPF